MNVARSTQLELLLITRTLDIIASTPGLSVASFFDGFIQAIQSLPEGSLSAYWKKFFEGRSTIVDVKASDSKEGVDEIVPGIAELDYLRTVNHSEVRHDPLLIVRKLYETAANSLLSSNTEEKSSLLFSCLVLAAKSARASLLTHTVGLLYIFRDESLGIKVKILKDLVKRTKDLFLENQSKLASHRSLKPVIDLRTFDMKNSKQLLEVGQSLVLSFGKADHGEYFMNRSQGQQILIYYVIGKLGLGDAQLNRLIPTVVESLRGKHIVKVVSMSAYSLALNSEGQVYIWGTGGTVGTMPTSKADITPQLLDALPLRVNIIDASCGLGHALFLTSFGRVFAWGNGGNGRLGLGDTQDRTEACVIGSLCEENITAIACGASHSLALTAKGQVYTWGKNTQGQCGHGTIEDLLKPALMRKLLDKNLQIIQVSAGWEHSLVLSSEGKMYSWGSGYKDSRRGVIPPVLGLGHSECRTTPELISSIETIKIAAIASGWDHCLALDNDGKLLSWGSGQNGKLGHGNEENISVPCYIPALENVVVSRMAAGCEHSAAITMDGILYSWGHGDGGRLGIGSNSQSFLPTPVKTMEEMKIVPHFLHCGDKFTVVIGHCTHSEFWSKAAKTHVESSYQWNLAEVQQWMTTHASFAADKKDSATSRDSPSVTPPPSLVEVERLLKFINDADDETLCNNEESLSLILHCMLQTGSSSLLDSLRPPANAQPIMKESDLYDQELCIEICEDTFSNLFHLLEMLTPLYLDYLQLFMKVIVESEPIIPINRSKLMNSSALNLLIMQVYAVLSLNLSVLSSYVRFQQEAEKQSKPPTNTSAVLEGSDHSEEQKEMSDRLEDEKEKVGVSVTASTSLNMKLLSDVDLRFAFARDSSSPENNHGVGDTNGLKMSEGKSADSYRDSSVNSPQKQLNSSGKFRNTAARQKKRAKRSKESNNNNPNTSLDSISRQEIGHEKESDNDNDEADDEYDDYSQSESETSQLYSGRNRYLRRLDSEEGEDTGSELLQRENAPSPAPSYESLENSFEEGGRDRKQRNGDSYSVASSLRESDDYQSDGESSPHHLRGEDENDPELQEALLSSIDSSRRAGLRLLQFPLLKPIEQRRGQILLPKIRNLLNTTASLTFLSIQQYYEQGIVPVIDDPTSSLTSAEVDAMISKIRLTWETTQLVTAAGIDSLYDVQEQRSVLLQIIRSPESFLYIIPGLISGFLKPYLSPSFPQMIELLFADSFDMFYECNTIDEASASNCLGIDDVLRVLQNLVSLYQRRVEEEDGSNVLNKIYEQITGSFGELVAEIVSFPIQWFLKTDLQEISIADASSTEPWGSKMEAILELLLASIKEDLTKSKNRFTSAVRERSTQLEEEFTSQITFSTKVLSNIYGKVTERTSTEQNWQIGALSALLPFSLQLISVFEQIYRDAALCISRIEDEQLFQSSAVIAPLEALKRWHHSHMAYFESYLSHLLFYLHRMPRKWLSGSDTIRGLSCDVVDYTYCEEGQVKRYLTDWEQIVWSSLSTRFSSLSNKLDLPAFRSPQKVACISTEDCLSIAQELVQYLFAAPKQEAALPLVSIWQEKVKESPGGLESRLVRFLSELFEQLMSHTPAQPSQQPLETEKLTNRNASAATLFASSTYSTAPDEMKMMDSFLDAKSDTDNDSERLLSRREDDSHEFTALDDFLQRQRKEIFLYLLKTFLSSEHKVENPDSTTERLSGTIVAALLVFTIQELLSEAITEGHAHVQLNSVIHISRLQELSLRVELTSLPSFSEVLRNLSLPGLQKEDPQDTLIRKDLAEQFLESLRGYAEDYIGEIRLFDQFHNRHSSIAHHSPSQLISDWRDSIRHQPFRPRFKATRTPVHLLLLFFSRYSSNLLRTGFLEQLSAKNKESSYLLFDWILPKYQNLIIESPETSQIFAISKDSPFPLLLCLREQCIKLNTVHGYSSPMVLYPALATKNLSFQRVPRVSNSLSTILHLLHSRKQVLRQTSTPFVEKLRLHRKTKDITLLLPAIEGIRSAISDQLDFYTGLSFFTQFSSAEDIGALHIPILQWWQEILYSCSRIMVFHPLYRYDCLDSKGLSQLLSTVGAKFFQENVALTLLLERIIALMVQTTHTQPLCHSESSIQTQIIEQEQQRMLTTLLSVLKLLVQNLSFYHELLTSHYWLLKDYGVQYLFCKKYCLDQNSPMIASNLCAPQGNFTIACWLFLPTNLVEQCSRQREKDTDGNGPRIHLFSRISESGDVNMIDLITKSPTEIDSYTLTAHLLFESQNKKWKLEVAAISTVYEEPRSSANNTNNTNNTTNRKKTVHRKTLTTRSLPYLKWVNIGIEVLHLPTSAAASSVDQCVIVVTVDNAIEARESIPNGKWPLHENMVIGKLPDHLFEGSDPFIRLNPSLKQESAFDPFGIGMTDASQSHRGIDQAVLPPNPTLRDNELQIADLIWVPTSFLFEDLVRHHGKQLLATDLDHYLNLKGAVNNSPLHLEHRLACQLPVVPTEVFSVLQISRRCLNRILSLFVSYYELDNRVYSLYHYEITAKLFQLFPTMTVSGDKETQRNTLELYRHFTRNVLSLDHLQEMFALLDEEQRSSIAFSDDEDDDDDAESDDNEEKDHFSLFDAEGGGRSSLDDSSLLDSSFEESHSKRPVLSKAITPVVGSTRQLKQLKHQFQQQQQYRSQQLHQSSSAFLPTLNQLQLTRLFKYMMTSIKWMISLLASIMNPYFFLQTSSAVDPMHLSSTWMSSNPLSSALTINDDILCFQLPWIQQLPISSQRQARLQHLWQLWCKRLYLQRISIDFMTNTMQWTQALFSVDENALLHDITGVFTAFCAKFPEGVPKLLKELLLLNNHAAQYPEWMASYEKMAIDFVFYVSCGGWFPTVNHGSRVVYNPRRVYLTRNHRSHVDESMFTSEGVIEVEEASWMNGMIQILLKQSSGAYETYDYLNKYSFSSTSPIDFSANQVFTDLSKPPTTTSSNYCVQTEKDSPLCLPSHPVILPAKENKYIPMTEMVLVKDRITLQDLKNFNSFFQHQPFSGPSAVATPGSNPSVPLLELLKLILLYSKRNETNSGLLSKPTEGKGPTQQLTLSQKVSSKHLSSSVKHSRTSTGTTTPIDLNQSFEDEKPTHTSSSNNNNILHVLNQLMLLVSALRTHVVQLTQSPDLSSDPSEQFSWKWTTLGTMPFSNLAKDLPSILTMASFDPVEVASSVFDSSAFKGVQVDVLRNLLREGDIAFLEKLSTKLWKQFKTEDQEIFYQYSVLSLEAPLQLVSIQGEVTIVGTKVKALSHFPSIKLMGVGLEKMSGRWFYECMLLSDGLMQIGWANSLFRCDPVCGQGVGDHVHSWAFDGLRTKKWNVSCEAYGRRWRLGDVVGVLVDMDLMEMRYYLNGEDLGVAFEDFSGYEIFPAFSLNVRQSIRLNFGQYKFMYPPIQPEGQTFRPIIQAIAEKRAAANGNVANTGGNTSPSKSVSQKEKSATTSEENGPGNISRTTNTTFDEQARSSMDIVSVHGSDPSPTGGGPTASSNAVVSNSSAERLAGGNEVRRILMQANQRRSSVISPANSPSHDRGNTDSPQANIPGRANEQDDKSMIEMSFDGQNDRSGLQYDSEEGDENNEDEENEEEQEHSRQRYSPWEEDIEARIRREVEEGDDYEEEEDDQQDDEEEDDDNDGSNGNEQEEEDDAEESGHIMELRRQALIESLIGMGFPVDWALRAAEQVDVATSESAAISWIIERMELEQGKISEMDGDSSSRGANEAEEDEEAESGIEYFMQRHAATFGSGGGVSTGITGTSGGGLSVNNSDTRGAANNRALNDANAMMTRRLVAEHMAELLENASNLENVMNSAANMASWSPGSPSRDESIASGSMLLNALTANTASGRTLLNPAALNVLMNTDAAYAALMTAKINANKKAKVIHSLDGNLGNSQSGAGDHSSLRDIDGLDLIFNNSVPWNNESSFPPMLPGIYSVCHRHDNEKQEVLSQVNDLDVLDMLPIISTCQFALCIYYSRMIVHRLIQYFLRQQQRQQDLLKLIQSSDLSLPVSPGVASAALISPDLEQFLSLFNVVSLYKFFKNSFRQAILSSNQQSDRIFPFLSPATSQGDLAEKVPPCAPFLAGHRLRFHELLRHLELYFYSDCFASIAIDEPSTEIIRSLEHFLILITTQAIEYTEKTLPAEQIAQSGRTTLLDSQTSNNIGTVNQSSISSSLSVLQDRILQRVGLASPSSPPPIDLPTASTVLRVGEMCNNFLSTMIENCLATLERAASMMKFDAFDWISGCLEKTPQHLFNEYHQKQYPSSALGDSIFTAEEGFSSSFPQVLFSFWCLKLILSIAIQYKIRENHLFLCSSRQVVSEDNPNNQSSIRDQPNKKAKKKQPLDASPFPFSPITQNSPGVEENIFSKKSALFKLTTPEALTRILKMSSTQNDSLRYCLFDLSTMVLSLVNSQLQLTLMKDVQYRLLQSSPLTQITAAEYYVSVAKEKRLLQVLSVRLKTERSEKQLFTRYTRSMVNFLFQWYFLRRQLNLSTFSYLTEFKLSNLSPFSSLPYCESGEEGGEEKEEDEEEEDDTDRLKGTRHRYLRVVQVSTSSITISWSLMKMAAELTTLKKGIEAMELAESPDHPLLLSYNLYITGLSYLGMETPMLVLGNIDYSGQFRLDDLEPDTLYKITIKSDEKKRMRKLRVARLREARRQRREMKRQGQGYEEEEDEEEEDEDDEEEEDYSNCDEDDNDERDNEEEQDPLRSAYHPFLSRSAKSMSVVVATESEGTFGFDSDSVCSNIVISASNPLTLRNAVNKKWSTARANIRFTSGIHRWEVHIDRCISKNIFIGVTTREARLDNYVGCDAYGWAFLANKAIWHGKAKMKNYGELFRTGDTVTIILDLENGTLSFCLNDRPLGVAVEGLVGPLYPAFSLYNEDDQLTILPMKTTSEQHSSGSFAVEMILDRMEAVRCLMQYFSFCHHRTMDEYQIQALTTGYQKEEKAADPSKSEQTTILSLTSDTSKVEGADSPSGKNKQRPSLPPSLGEIQKQYSNLSVEDNFPPQIMASNQPQIDQSYKVTTPERRNSDPEDDNGGNDEDDEEEETRLQLLQQYSSKFSLFSEELLHEIYLRYQNWIGNVAVRTIYHQNNMYSILLSEDSIQRFTRKSLHLNDFVTVEKRLARVIGVGASKLWLRVETDGEYIALTRETFLQMRLVDLAPDLEALSLPKDGNLFDGACGSHRQVSAIVLASSFEYDQLKVQTLSDVKPLSFHQLKGFLYEKMGAWSAEDDQAVLYLLSLFASRMSSESRDPQKNRQRTLLSSDYFSFSYLEFYYFLFSFHSQVLPKLRSITETGRSFFRSCNALRKLFADHSLEEILLRILLLHMLNDLFLPLQPILLPYSNADGRSKENDWLIPRYHQDYLSTAPEVSGSHPTNLLKSLRHLLYPLSKQQMMTAMCYEYSLKVKDWMKAFYSFYSSLKYTSLVTVIPEDGNSRKKLNPLEKWRMQHRQQQSLERPIDTNSPLTIPPSPQRDNQSQANPTLFGQTLGVVSSFDVGHSNNNNRVSPATLFSSTAPPLFQRGYTESSMNSLMSNPFEESQAERERGVSGDYGALPSNALTRQTTRTNMFGNNVADPTTKTPIGMNSTQQKILSLVDLPLMQDHQFILYLEDSGRFYHSLQQFSQEKGAFERIDVQEPDNSEKRNWQLLYWLQTSYLGQFVQYLELLQMKFVQENVLHTRSGTTYRSLQSISALSHVLPHQPLGGSGANANQAKDKKGGADSPSASNFSKESRRDFSVWEHCFRYHYMNLPDSDATQIGGKARRSRKALPILIRCLPDSLSDQSSGRILPTSRLKQYLTIREASPHLVSEETIFRVFLQEACDQIQQLIDVLYPGTAASSSQSLKELIVAEKELLDHCHVGEISLLLQIFHAVGVLVGLAWRNGFTPSLQFPALFYSILANEDIQDTSPFFPSTLLSISLISSADKSDQEGVEGKERFAEEYEEYRRNMSVLSSSLKVFHSIALVVRYGICSVFPEVLVDLWTKEEIQSHLGSSLRSLPTSLFSPSCLSAERLMSYCHYDESIDPQHDLFIHNFWICLYETREEQFRIFLRHLFAKAIDEFYSSSFPSTNDAQTVQNQSVLQSWLEDVYFSAAESEVDRRISIVQRVITLQDIDVSVSASLATTYIAVDDYPIEIDPTTRSIILPNYSSLTIMSTKWQELLNVIDRSRPK